MSFIGWFITGILILPAIIYYTARAAVKEGTFDALIEFQEYKRSKQQD